MTGRPLRTVLVVGAGPAGRALAHRALARGLAVTVVDPAPEQEWTSTFGMFTDDVPEWLPRRVIAASSPRFVVYTPERREVDRGYCTLSTGALHQALALDGAALERHRAVRVSARRVLLDDGRELTADHVVDARGAGHADPAVPRQRAYGTFHRSGHRPAAAPEMVLMDWRRTPATDPSFSYRVDLGDGFRLVEETCLAGAPATTMAELARRNSERGEIDGTRAAPEEVDFPLYVDRAPWRRADGALAFGAGGGLMHPATGYSIAASLHAADAVAAAIADGRDPARELWSHRARWTFRLRLIGLAVLLGFDGRGLQEFFDAFFTLPPERQRAYLSGRADPGGTAATMWAVFRCLSMRMRGQLLFGTARALVVRR